MGRRSLSFALLILLVSYAHSACLNTTKTTIIPVGGIFAVKLISPSTQVSANFPYKVLTKKDILLFEKSSSDQIEISTTLIGSNIASDLSLDTLFMGDRTLMVTVGYTGASTTSSGTDSTNGGSTSGSGSTTGGSGSTTGDSTSTAGVTTNDSQISSSNTITISFFTLFSTILAIFGSKNIRVTATLLLISLAFCTTNAQCSTYTITTIRIPDDIRIICNNEFCFTNAKSSTGFQIKYFYGGKKKAGKLNNFFLKANLQN
jgi:hypothetical protein